MLAIGAAAGAASFTHVHDVAASHGQPGWLAWADAVVLELMSVASGLELRRRKCVREPLWFPAVVLVVAVVLSLGAQVVEAEPSVIGWIAAALPAVGFLAMVKIALGHAGTGHSRRDESSSAVPDGSRPSRTGPRRPHPVPDGDNSRPSGTAPVPAADRDADGEVRGLLAAARLAAAEITGQGRPLSREAVMQVMRGNGHALSNARGSALVKLLRDEADASR